MVQSKSDNTADLEKQIKKLQSQRDTLLKELDGVEERFEKTDRLYKKYFPLIIDTFATGGTSFSKSCKDLSVALKKGASPGKIEYIFEQLKNAMLKEDIGPVPIKKKKGLFSSFVKDTTTNFVDDFKHQYHEVVNTLRSTLDDKYKTKLNNISKRIINAADTTDISELRESIFQLIFAYISDTNVDREKVNKFIREIMGKILEIESKFSDSFEQTDSVFEINQGFESVLDTEMGGIKESTNVAASLDDLKVQISQRLTSIENALQKKKAKDDAIKKIAKQNRNNFQSGFAKLKQELDEATQYSEELEKKLNLDQLTGAFNRRAYDKKIDDEMTRFTRYGSMFSLLLLDADKFKRINDTYGHAVGDRCLQEIIKRSIPLLRKNDMLARYGGEEFVVIMPETDADGARKAAEKIRKTIEKIEFLYKKETVRVTVSIGVTQAQKGDKNHQEIFERADIAVYKAKENGRNQVLVYDGS
ncbi:MAG: GGDEF domain-containing protein [Desulfobacteraceae bacterium]|nr:GGDEF domain-containing protein [Desulfobacteraceae bacterium]